MRTVPGAASSGKQVGTSLDPTHTGMTAVAWADDRIGTNAIYIENVNGNCTLGKSQNSRRS